MNESVSKTVKRLLTEAYAPLGTPGFPQKVTATPGGSGMGAGKSRGLIWRTSIAGYYGAIYNLGPRGFKWMLQKRYGGSVDTEQIASGLTADFSSALEVLEDKLEKILAKQKIKYTRQGKAVEPEFDEPLGLS